VDAPICYDERVLRAGGVGADVHVAEDKGEDLVSEFGGEAEEVAVAVAVLSCARGPCVSDAGGVRERWGFE
jgi:hypothetical protein